jgi:hypothetical protein
MNALHSVRIHAAIALRLYYDCAAFQCDRCAFTLLLYSVYDAIALRSLYIRDAFAMRS